MCLLTLTGAGGVVKTRIALRVASEVRGGFADGIFFVPLATIADPVLLHSTVTHPLGIAKASERAAGDALVPYLRDAELLLVLDNFEQLVQAAPPCGSRAAKAGRNDSLSAV